MSIDNAKLVMGLNLQLASALARNDEAGSSELIADDIVWTHVNARVTEDKEAVFEPWRSGDGAYAAL
jgi:Domain of unknown function (DUF4440)